MFRSLFSKIRRALSADRSEGGILPWWILGSSRDDIYREHGVGSSGDVRPTGGFDADIGAGNDAGGW